MTFNSEDEKKSLKESLKNTESLPKTIKYLEHILKYRTPFALYIATADRTDCMWIFDPDTIYNMVGGTSEYKKIFNSLFTSDEEKFTGVVFFIFRKVGPIYSIRIDLELISEIINDLYNEL